MSEKSPRFNPRELLNNWDANEESHKQDLVDNYHQELVGEEAGTSNFSDEKRSQLEELVRYQEWGDDHKGESQQEYENRIFDELRNEHDVRDEMLSQDWDEAHEIHKQYIIDERNARIAEKGNGELRQLKQAAENVLEARHALVTENAEAQLEREQDVTDRFYELWYRYEEKHGDKNKDILDYFADSIDNPTEEGSKTKDANQNRPVTHYDESMTNGPDRPDLVYDKNMMHGPDREPVTYDKDTPFGPYELPATYDKDVMFGPEAIDPGKLPFVKAESTKDNEQDGEASKKTIRQRLHDIIFNRGDKNADKNEKKAWTKRAKVGIALGLVGLLGAGITAYNMNKEQTIEQEQPSDEGAQQTPENDGDHKDDATEATKAKERKALMEADAWNIPAGGGGIKVLENLGLEEADWYNNNLDQKLLKKFPGTFYNHNGDVRIAKQGELPDEVKAYIIDQTDLLK